jgi:hypothetical protein
MQSSGMLCHVAHVSQECSASIIRVTNRLQVTANIVLSSPILVTLKMEALLKHRFLQEPHGVTSQKTAFFIVTAVKTSDLTIWQ